jgi:hypothetical protein
LLGIESTGLRRCYSCKVVAMGKGGGSVLAAKNNHREGVYIGESFGVWIKDFFNQPYLKSDFDSTDLVWIRLGIKLIRFQSKLHCSRWSLTQF